MGDPTDQPSEQAESGCGEPAVRADVGGWISGPCLDAEELGLLADWRPDAGPTWPEGRRQRPVQ